MENFYYRRLDVYKNAKQLLIRVYEILHTLPTEEKYALGDQLRRATQSIAFNIAEGFGRYSTKERLHFLEIANGSLMEVSCQLDIANTVGYIDSNILEEMDSRLIVIAKQLANLKKRLSTTQPTSNIPLSPNT